MVIFYLYFLHTHEQFYGDKHEKQNLKQMPENILMISVSS